MSALTHEASVQLCERVKSAGDGPAYTISIPLSMVLTADQADRLLSAERMIREVSMELLLTQNEELKKEMLRQGLRY